MISAHRGVWGSYGWAFYHVIFAENDDANNVLQRACNPRLSVSTLKHFFIRKNSKHKLEIKKSV